MPFSGKTEYLGDRYCCNRREQKLAALADFPPLNYTCYPAISKEYLVERDDAWRPTGQALAVMEELLKEVGDKQLLRLVRLYAMFPVKILTRYIAMQLHRSKHKKWRKSCCSRYGRRQKAYPNENSPEKKKNSSGSRENEHRTMRKSGKQEDTGQIFFGRNRL